MNDTESKRSIKTFACMECGKKMTTNAARKAFMDGCTNCGGSDIDLIIPREKWFSGRGTKDIDK